MSGHREQQREMAVATDVQLEATDGTPLTMRYLKPVGPVKGVCVAAHALMANGGSLCGRGTPALADTLAQGGYHVYVLDLRGHGRSRTGRSAWSFDQLVFADVPSAYAWVRARHPQLPLGAVGHSLAGCAMLAHLTVADGDVPDGLVTISTNIWRRSSDPSLARSIRKLGVLTALALASAPQGRFPARALRVGREDIPAAFARDLLRWFITDDWADRDGRRFGQPPGHQIPVLSVYGSADRFMSRPDVGLPLHAAIAGTAHEALVVGRERVGFDPGHMGIGLDARCRPAWEDITAWLTNALADKNRRRRTNVAPRAR